MNSLLYFSSAWCGPCKLVKPLIEEYSNQYNLLKIDLAADPEAFTTRKIKSVPTVIIEKDGVEVARLIGKEINKESLNLHII